MNTQLRLANLLIIAILWTGCQLIQPSTPTPMPGWRSPVYRLLADDSIFPQGWSVLFPQDTSTDPTANHVGRQWGNTGKANGTAKAEQAIWRSYTVSDAKAKYDELQNQFSPAPPPVPDAIFVEFKPPAQIVIQSQVADRFHLACGWYYRPYCVVVAQYRNYVTDMRMDLQEDYKGVHADGLTYQEIETIIAIMDAKFARGLPDLPTTSP